METSADEVIRLLQVNLLGAMLVTGAVLPEMQQRHHGAIISIDKAQAELGFAPQVSLREGVRLACIWYQQHYMPAANAIYSFSVSDTHQYIKPICDGCLAHPFAE